MLVVVFHILRRWTGVHQMEFVSTQGGNKITKGELLTLGRDIRNKTGY